MSASITSNGMTGGLRSEGKRFASRWATTAIGEPTDNPSVLFGEPIDDPSVLLVSRQARCRRPAGAITAARGTI
jgi:hypothetical protein